jgi:hypothetical protein
MVLMGGGPNHVIVGSQPFYRESNSGVATPNLDLSHPFSRKSGFSANLIRSGVFNKSQIFTKNRPRLTRSEQF